MRTRTLLTLCQLIVTAQSSEITRRESASQTKDHILLLVHASTAVLAWALFFPLGSILLRLIESKNAIWIHAGIQVFATLIYTVAVGTGISLAEKYQVLNVYHPVLGLSIFALMFVQIAGGILHHLFFRKYLRRTVISYIHIWLGRILVTAGIINGGLGLLMAYRRPTVAQIAAYSVLAGIMWVIFIVVGFVKGPVRTGKSERHEVVRSKGERRVGDLGPPRVRERVKEPEKALLIA